MEILHDCWYEIYEDSRDTIPGGMLLSQRPPTTAEPLLLVGNTFGGTQQWHKSQADRQSGEVIRRESRHLSRPLADCRLAFRRPCRRSRSNLRPGRGRIDASSPAGGAWLGSLSNADQRTIRPRIFTGPSLDYLSLVHACPIVSDFPTGKFGFAASRVRKLNRSASQQRHGMLG